MGSPAYTSREVVNHDKVEQVAAELAEAGVAAGVVVVNESGEVRFCFHVARGAASGVLTSLWCGADGLSKVLAQHVLIEQPVQGSS